MAEAEHRSRRYRWEQFSELELWHILCRLQKELNITQPDMIPPRYKMEETINVLSEEKGRRVAEHQTQGGADT